MIMRNTAQNQACGGIVRVLSGQLIQARCDESQKYENLKRAIRDSVSHGASIDSLSEESGLPPAEVRKISESQEYIGDRTALVGIV